MNKRDYFVVNGKRVNANGESLEIDDIITKLDADIAELNAKRAKSLADYLKEYPEHADEINRKFVQNVQELVASANPLVESVTLPGNEEDKPEVDTRPTPETKDGVVVATEHSNDKPDKSDYEELVEKAKSLDIKFESPRPSRAWLREQIKLKED